MFRAAQSVRATQFFGIPALAWMFLMPVHGANLKPETVKAWDEYVQVVDSLARSQSARQCFLWTDESRDRWAKVRGGEIVVAPARAAHSIEVPSGLIHHWVGAVFVPNANIEQVSAVMRDYANYKKIFHPTVVDSKSVAWTEAEDRFSLVLANKSLVKKAALETDYKATQVVVNDRRRYTITQATRIQEISGYGTPDQHKLPENEGMGLIWRLYGITRFEERDGGVYVEVEAIVLSRDIPGTIRWFVDPIVRRVAKSSFTTSLQQTHDAVRSNSRLVTQTSGSAAPGRY